MKRMFVLFGFMIVMNTISFSQISGTYTIPGATYPTITSAIAALNASGVGSGGVTFNVTAGYTETFVSPTAGYFTIPINMPNASNQIVFQKSGSGADPLITAGVGTGNFDAIIAFSGISYVTFNGIDLQENALNTTAVTEMEYGFALLKASGTQGSQNITIENCIITLNKANTNVTYGIYSNNGTTAAPTTALTVTAISGANSNNKFYGNTITNCYDGIYLYGFASATPYAFYDQNNDIGSLTGNTITNFGGGAVITYCVYINYQNGILIANCNINGGTGTTASMYGIYGGTGTNSNASIYGNTVTLISSGTSGYIYGIYNNATGTAGTTNTLNIYNNTVQNCTEPGATTAYFYGIYNGATSFNVNFYGNTVTNNLIAGSDYMYLCYTTSGTGGTGNVYNNIVTNNQRLGTGTQSGTAYLYCLECIGSATYSIHDNTISGNSAPAQVSYGSYIYSLYASNSSPSQTVYNNTIHDQTITSSSSAALGMYGIYSYPSSTSTGNIYNNTVYNLTINSNSSGSAYIYGCYNYYGSSLYLNNVYNLTANTTSNYADIYGILSYYPSSVYSNNIYNVNITTSGVGYGYGWGLYLGATANINAYKNKVYGVSMAGSPAYFYGIYVAGGSTVNLYNNFVSDLKAPTSTSVKAATGVYIAGGTNVNLYYNTIYLNAAGASTTTFGTNGIYASTTPIVELRNNIVVNTSTAPSSTTYITSAYSRSSSMLNTYVGTSNNNLFYAGSPSPNNLVYYDGTNNMQTLASYKSLVSPIDAESVTELPPFVNITTTPYDLHIMTTVPTQCESNGSVVSTPVNITTDYDGDARYPNPGYPNNIASPATGPDIGADEFGGIKNDLTPPNIFFTPLVNTSSMTVRTLTTTITDGTGVPTTGIGLPILYWKKFAAGSWNTSTATWGSGSTYSFTLGSGVVLNDSIYYFIVAQDTWTIPNVGSSPYNGSGYTANPPACSSPPPNASLYSYKIVSPICGTFNVGVGQTYTTITAALTDIGNKEITCPVTLVLTDATYPSETFPITFLNFPGLSSVNTLTIKPLTTSIISGSSTSTILMFAQSKYIIIDGSNSGSTDRSLTINNTATSGTTAVIWVGSNGTGLGSTNITIKNCNLANGFSTSTSYGIYAGSTAGFGISGDNNDNLTIQNNSISTAYFGIFIYASAMGLNNNLVISNNVIGSSVPANYISFYGIYLNGANAPQVISNEIYNIITSASYGVCGIELYSNITNPLIQGNKIHDLQCNSSLGWGAYGIDLGSSSNVLNASLINNLIYNITTINYSISNTIYNPFGIRIAGGTGHKIYHNTVNMAGTQFNTGSAGTLSAALLVTTNSVTGLDVRDNIFANSLVGLTGSLSYCVYVPAGFAFGTSNYNDFWPSGTFGILGYFGAAEASLAAWQSASGQDGNSLNINPSFVSNSDMHPTATGLMKTGILIPSVLVDYAGTARTNPPDIGAYQFSAAPVINTSAASPVSGTTATLNGSINANNATVISGFDYGLTTGYGTSVAAVPPTVNGTTVTTISQPITGLTPSTLYHFRAKGTSANVFPGNDLTFTTPSLPSVITTTATGLIGTTATLNGTINANGYSTTVTFDYGLTVSYGTTVPGVPSPVTGSVVTPVAASITGLLPGTLYHYRVDGTSIGGLVNGGDVTFTTPAFPTVVTTAATGVTGTTATVNGTINANNSSTTVTFDYGLTTAYGTTVPGIPSPVTGSVVTSVSAALSGLLPGNLYHYRVDGVNAAGSVNGGDLTFTTPVISPTVVTNAATNITITTATLNGTVTANGASTAVTFDYGLTVAYGTNVQGTPTPVTGNTATNVSANITGLLSNTLYHYRVNGVNSVGTVNGNDMTFTTVCPVAGPAGPISGPTQVCQGGSGYIYSVTIPNASGYVWTLPIGGTITSGFNTNTITVSYAYNAVTGYLMVYGTATCGNGSPSQLGITMNPYPTPTIAGPSSVCVNSTGNTYTTQSGMTNYLWNVTGGTITAGGGTANNTVTVTWTSVGAKTVCVNYANANGCAGIAPVCYPVTVNPLPVPTISGPASACTTVPVVYTTQTGMTSYVWTITAGGQITGGLGSSSISVTWNTAGSQSVSANYTNANGCTAPSPTVYPVTVNSSTTPTITGSTSLCVNSGYYTYSTQSGMTNYVWNISSGGIINYGSGTNAITVSWLASGAQWVNVNFTNTSGCTLPNPTQLNVTVNPLPGAAGSITGTSAVCGGANGVAYSVATITGATAYVWTLPTGATIASGANTNSITVNFAWNASSGAIIVAGNNTCGNGPSSPPFNVTVTPLPAPAGTITGPASVCLGATGEVYTVPPITGATTYAWTVPTGFITTGGSNTNSITVTISNSAVSGNITVYGSNSCGNGTVSPDFAVAVNPVPPAPVVTNTGTTLQSSASADNQWYFQGTLIPGATGQTYVATQDGYYWDVVTLDGCSSDASNHVLILLTGIEQHSSAAIKIYPVPNDGQFNISITTDSEESFTIRVYNNLGVKIHEETKVDVNGTLQKVIDLRPVPDGVYTVIFENSQNQVVKKIIVNK
jgi:hypothetical protein